MSGFGWYRFNLRIPEGTQPLALYFPRMMTSYEVYADGHKLGAFGGMPPYRKLLTGRPPLYVLPGVGSPGEKTVVIAIRVWHWPFWAHYYGGGPQSAGYVGEISAIDRMRRDDFPGNPWSWAPPLFSAMMCLIGGIFALGFASLNRRVPLRRHERLGQQSKMSSGSDSRNRPRPEVGRRLRSHCRIFAMAIKANAPIEDGLDTKQQSRPRLTPLRPPSPDRICPKQRSSAGH